MRQLFRFSFYSRIQLSFLLFIMLPTLAVSIYSYSLIKDNVTEKFKLGNESMLALMTKDLTKMIDDVTFASNFFIQDLNVRSRLRSFKDVGKIESSKDADNYMQIRDFFGLVSAKTMNNDIQMFIVNNRGFIVQASDSMVISPEQIVGYYNSVKDRVDPSQPNVIQWLGTSRINNETIYFMSRVLQDPSDYSSLGTLYIGIPETYFHKFFLQLRAGNYALFDQEGERITGDENLALDQVSKDQAQIRNVSLIPKANWTLVFETPKQAVTGQISRTFYLSLLVVFPCFIMFWLISVMVGKRLHRPIRILQRGIRKIGEGNRNVRFPDEGGDEIAELGRTLNEMLGQINSLIHNIEQEQEQKRMMELQALFSQIRPHFLLNTLNSIKCNLSLADDPVHSRQIDSLMSLLRAYMKINEPSTLQSECKLLAHYVEIMQMRNEIELDFQVNVQVELLDMEMPKLLLQPLVENAFVHGFSEEPLSPRLVIEAARADEWIEIRVTNNGEGLKEERLGSLNDWLQGDRSSSDAYPRIGLRNVAERLRLTYGPSAGMYLEQHAGGDLTVILRIPYSQAQVR